MGVHERSSQWTSLFLTLIHCNKVLSPKGNKNFITNVFNFFTTMLCSTHKRFPDGGNIAIPDGAAEGTLLDESRLATAPPSYW